MESTQSIFEEKHMTVLGFVIQTIYYLICMIRSSQKGNQLLSLSPKNYHFTWNMTKQVTTIGIPGGLAIILMCVSNIILNNYLSIYGSNAVAAYGIAYKLNSIPVMLLVGLSQGVSPLIGYCYGAKQFKRLRASMNLSSLYSIILGVLFTSLFFLTGEFLSSLFLEQPDLIVESAHFLRILCCSAMAVAIICIVMYLASMKKLMKNY